MTPEQVPDHIVAVFVAEQWRNSSFPEHVREKFRPGIEASARRKIAAMWDLIRAWQP